MSQGASTFTCRRGHTSFEADYCSECGAKIEGGATSGMPLPAGSVLTAAEETCPDCGTPQESSRSTFCEVCGFNFVTGAHGEVPLPQAPIAVLADAVTTAAPLDEAPTAELPALPERAPIESVPVRHWSVTVTADPALRSPEGPQPPDGMPSFDVDLVEPVSLVGRRNEARAIFPEIALDHDEAVSRRHALLQLGPQGLLLRDIGSANGTRINGQEVRSMEDVPVQDGDQIALGHWTVLTIRAR